MIKTAESVSPKHPDKLCDRISDAILDACLTQDPTARCAIEVMGGHGSIDITGELTTKAYVNMRQIAESIVGKGYGIKINVIEQSREIADRVDLGGAGDQGIMVGYACSDNEDMIPQELYLARSLCKFVYEKYPTDGKTQITLKDNNAIEAIVVSFQGTKTNGLRDLVGVWATQMIEQGKITNSDFNLYANPAGDWEQGGFEADTGATGRKLVIDSYGPQVPIGGGAFSGKDATKVDRSGAYMARKLAVDYLGTLNAKEVTVKLAYAIGVVQPTMATMEVQMQNGDRFSSEITNKEYNLTPTGIIDYLGLRKPQFSKTAEWGHFGNKFNWDK